MLPRAIFLTNERVKENDLTNGAHHLPVNSVLFWLVMLPALGIIFIGVRFIITPLAGAKGFGVPAGGAETNAYLWAKGTRDIVSGLFPLVLLWLKAGRQVFSVYLFVVALVPLSDLANVYVHIGTSNIGALVIHGSTALYLIILAAVLLRKAEVTPPPQDG